MEQLGEQHGSLIGRTFTWGWLGRAAANGGLGQNEVAEA